MFERARVRIVGLTPLLMHNSRLADPLCEWKRKMAPIEGKQAKKRTEEDLLEWAFFEFMGGAYVNDEGRPVIPSRMFEACFTAAARTERKGKEAQRGFIVEADAVLEYEGPKTIEELWGEPRFVFRCPAKQNGRASVMRTRPRFDQWAVEFSAMVDTTLFPRPKAKEDGIVGRILRVAGEEKAIGDWRPKHGRFSVEWIKWEG